MAKILDAAAGFIFFLFRGQGICVLCSRGITRSRHISRCGAWHRYDLRKADRQQMKSDTGSLTQELHTGFLVDIMTRVKITPA